MPLPEKTAADILALDDRPFFQVDVPPWGCSVWCRELDVAESCKIRNSARDGDNIRQDDFALKVVLEGTFKKAADGTFSKMFVPGDYERLKSKGKAIAIIAAAISDGKKNEPLKS